MSKITQNPITYTLREVPINEVVVWEEAQARTLDMEGIDALARSISSEGLQNPPMAQKDGPHSYRLMAGQRRLAALKKLGSETIPILVLSTNSACDEENAKAVSIIENIHRKDMSAAEMTSSCQFLVERLGRKETAKMLGITTRTLREHLGFHVVPPHVQKLVPTLLSKRDAIKICKVITSESKAIEIINLISKYDAGKKKRYVLALVKAGGNATHSQIQNIANQFNTSQNLSIKMSKGQAKGLATLSKQCDMEPVEFARKLVVDYLSRKGYK